MASVEIPTVYLSDIINGGHIHPYYSFPSYTQRERESKDLSLEIEVKP